MEVVINQLFFYFSILVAAIYMYIALSVTPFANNKPVYSFLNISGYEYCWFPSSGAMFMCCRGI